MRTLPAKNCRNLKSKTYRSPQKTDRLACSGALVGTESEEKMGRAW